MPHSLGLHALLSIEANEVWHLLTGRLWQQKAANLMSTQDSRRAGPFFISWLSPREGTEHLNSSNLDSLETLRHPP